MYADKRTLELYTMESIKHKHRIAETTTLTDDDIIKLGYLVILPATTMPEYNEDTQCLVRVGIKDIGNGTWQESYKVFDK